MSDFVRGGGTGSGREEAGLNMVMLIQVPLKQRRPVRDAAMAAPGSLGGGGGMEMAKNRGSDVENAVIGHGEIEGPFTEIDGVRIERDERFPVRVTVQFYKATSNGVVRSQDLDEIKVRSTGFIGAPRTSGVW